LLSYILDIYKSDSKINASKLLFDTNFINLICEIID